MSAAKRYPVYLMTPPAAPARPSARTAIPAGSSARVTCDLLAFRFASVVVKNFGPGTVEVVHPDGEIPAPDVTAMVPAGRQLRLTNIRDEFQTLPLTITSDTGSEVMVTVVGQPRPLILGERTTPERDRTTGLIQRVDRRPALVRA